MKRIPFIVSLLLVLTLPALLISSCNSRTHIYKRSQLLMGTIVEITVAARDERTADEAINAAAGIHPVKVHKDLILAVKKSLQFADLSGGAFNIAIGPAIDLWNVTESEDIPTPAELAVTKPLIDYKNVIVNEGDGTIFLTKKGMRINLGGIGKGIAADYAHNVLKTYGISSGIIAVDGDLHAIGKRPDGSQWTIGITHPRREAGNKK